MIKDRDELEKHLKITINNVKHDNGITQKVRTQLLTKGIEFSRSQRMIISPNELSNEDLGVIYLLANALFLETKETNIDPKKYFTPKEMQKAESKSYAKEEDSLKFPLTLTKVLQLDEENYITTMDVKFLKRLFPLLEYNFETQRSPKYVRSSSDPDQIIETPDINFKSVKEIKELMNKYGYLPDTLTLNCLVGSAEADEIEYDVDSLELTINECEIDILDGFHRLTAIVDALDENPELDLQLQIAIKNYDIDTARRYFGQINTINKVDQAKLKSLKQDRYSDNIVKQLMRKSDLNGKISESSRPSHLKSQLVSFSVLADEIDKQFSINTKKEANDVAKFLIDFFDELVGTYPGAFLDEVEEFRRTSLINNNNMFVGYLVIARKLYEEEREPTEVSDIVGKVDFSKDNALWEDIGVLENGKQMNRQTKFIRTSIKKYFEENVNI